MNNNEGSENSHEVIVVLSNEQHDFARWRPRIGSETIDLLQNVNLPQESQTTARNEAVSILCRCVPPTIESGQETGLVVGYIQSGKTMSFTTVAALACDNQYPLVIVIAGTSVPLTGQSVSRLRQDLRLDSRSERKWRHIHNPRVENDDHERIGNVLGDWQDGTIPAEERRTVLVTVMKHHGHLNHLIDVLRHVSLENVPVLIVDDEADQAGLNNLIREGDESTTYQRLRVLKNTIPHHTFLQYTATPQGPLLINLIDVLSPGFAITLTPGPEYVGGRDLFLEQTPYVREIPEVEIPTRNNPLQEPPDSLLAALRLFFLGVAVGLVRSHGRGNRAMMIHPSRRTLGHAQYYTWVTAIRDCWIRILEDPEDPDASELLEDFREAHQDLHQTVTDLEPFDLVATRLLHAVRRTETHLVNARRGRTPQIDWSGAYSHILVGGQALDRGVTVEGLTITYMPRGVGARRADTIQQRARFFGYKRSYLPFCRVFLEQAVADAFRRYVRHEEDIRERLVVHSRSGRSLSDLRRIFLLTRSLVPTRDSILDIDYVRANFNEGWFYPRAPHDSEEFATNNRRVVQAFTNTLNLNPDEGHPDRTEIQRHQVAHDVPLRNVYEQLLAELRFARLSDAQNFLAILVILRRHFEEGPQTTCSVYNMSGGRGRIRRLNSDDEIPNLFQGAAPVYPRERRGEVYPGDREIRLSNAVTIQLHTLNIPARNGFNPEYRDIPNVAIWIPREVAGDVIIQDQGNLMDFEDE